MIKIFLESDKFSHIAGMTLHATNTLARTSQLIYVSGPDLNSNASLNMDASLSHSSMDVPGIAKLNVL